MKRKLAAIAGGLYLAAAMGGCIWNSVSVNAELPEEQGEEVRAEATTAPSMRDPGRSLLPIANSLAYGTAGQEELYIDSGEVYLQEGDTVSLLEAYAMPPLERMSGEDFPKYMDGLQVLERIERMGLEPASFFTPEYDWKAVYADSLTTVKTALDFSEEVDFRGNTASQLNAFLTGCERVSVNIRAEEILLDETIRVPSNVVLKGNGACISGTAAGGDDVAAYAFLLEDVENVGICGFRLDGGFGQGIYVLNSKVCLIWDNEITDAAYKAVCIMADSSYINLVNNRIYENGNGAVFLNGDISSCIIQGNEICQNRGTRNLTAGIVFASMEVEDPYTPYNEFKDEHLYDQLDSPHHNVVRDNRIRGNLSSGFYCDGGYLNYILDNLIADNEKEGMCLDYGTFGVYVSGNTICRNGNRKRQTDEDLEADFILEAGRLEDGSSTAKLPGISIDNSAYNIVMENMVSDNAGSGIKMVRSAYRNLILSNLVSDNNRGKNEAFHGFGIEFGHASDPDEPVIGLDFTADYENIAARNVISGGHYAGIFLAEGSYCNDLIDNVVMDSEFYSVENHSHLYNSSVGNTVNRDALNYGLNQ